MPKRKREDDPVSTPNVQPSETRRLTQRAEEQFLQSQEILGSKFKIARGFERQKLSRRLKNAKTGNDRMRIEGEIESLKVFPFLHLFYSPCCIFCDFFFPHTVLNINVVCHYVRLVEWDI